MTDQTTIETDGGLPAGELAEAVLAADDGDTTPRDYEGDARKHGWTPKEEFKGDPAKWVDAETFTRRADEVMPFLKKQNAALKRDIDDMKRTMKQFQDFASNAEKRAYERAVADIEARHAEAVETGDVDGAKKAVADLRKVEKDFTPPQVEDEPEFDENKAKAELADWVERSGYYGTDDVKTKYADTQANLMGAAANWPGGQAAWLAELDSRVERKFSAVNKPVVTTAGGARLGARGAARGYNDLPADAKKLCDKFVKSIPGFTREQYVRDYDWSN